MLFLFITHIHINSKERKLLDKRWHMKLLKLIGFYSVLGLIFITWLSAFVTSALLCTAWVVDFFSLQTPLITIHMREQFGSQACLVLLASGLLFGHLLLIMGWLSKIIKRVKSQNQV